MPAGSTGVVAARAGAVAQVVFGGVLAARPATVARAAAGAGERPAPSWIVRVLGARVLLQAALVAVAPSRSLLRLAAAVDTTHAASMAVLAVREPSVRRSAVVSGAAASVWAVVSLASARRLAGS